MYTKLNPRIGSGSHRSTGGSGSAKFKIIAEPLILLSCHLPSGRSLAQDRAVGSDLDGHPFGAQPLRRQFAAETSIRVTTDVQRAVPVRCATPA
jgi:hypothetical protein